MADTLENELNAPSEAETRIKDLSGKVKAASEQAESERQAREAAEAKALEVERERDFYQNFTDVVAKNPAATDHRDEILEKVKGGYSVEDAALAVLAKAGKLSQPMVEPASPAGGSAATVIPQNAQKSVQEMTQEERRQALVEAEARGDIGLS